MKHRRFEMPPAYVLLLILLTVNTSPAAADPPAKDSLAAKPPWQRMLQGEDLRKANELQKQIDKHWEAVEFQQALKLAEDLLALRERVQGADHWEAAEARWKFKTIQSILTWSLSDQIEIAALPALKRKALTLLHQPLERQRDAQALWEQLLKTQRKLLGEKHPDMCATWVRLGECLGAQGNHPAAEQNFQKAVDLLQKTLGTNVPHLAPWFANLAHYQNELGKYRTAEGNLRKAVELQRKLWPDEGPVVAFIYSEAGHNFQLQGKYSQADQYLRMSLDLARKGFGEEHRVTAGHHLNLAKNQRLQGNYTESEVNTRRSLELCRRLLGEEHLETATMYQQLGEMQMTQEKYIDAERSVSTALKIYLRMQSERTGPVTRYGALNEVVIASLYLSLGRSQMHQGKFPEANDNFQKALQLHRRAKGDQHPNNGILYMWLAANQSEEGKFGDAQENYLRALELYRTVLGELHPHTVSAYRELALIQHAQAKFAEAERLATESADLFEQTRRWIAFTGLERAATSGKRTPVLFLAGVLARNSKPAMAWQRLEQSLARGTLDDLTRKRFLQPTESAQHAEILERLNYLNRRILESAAGKETPGTAQQRKELFEQRFRTQKELNDWTRLMEEKHGPAAGAILDRTQIQQVLKDDAAFLGWVDFTVRPKAVDPTGEHWAMLLRSKGDPIWIQLPRTGPNDTWSNADESLADEVRQTLQKPKSGWQELARKLRAQRLDPLAKHLAAGNGLPAVRHLIVLPSPKMDGLPFDVVADGYTVSYAPSGTIYTYLQQQKRPESQDLLAVADPVFEKPKTDSPEPKLPAGGVLIDVVTPGSAAATAELKAGDVLLRYAGTELNSLDDLTKAIQAHAKDREVTLTIWRNGESKAKLAPPGQLGIVVARESAPKVLAERRQFQQQLAAARRSDDGGDWQPLPGTRVEAEALKRLFQSQKRPVRLLTDSAASEQALDGMARKNQLGQYRFIHLATHGKLDAQTALRSALILSRDNLPDPYKQMDAGEPIYDGRLTAAEVLQNWHLNAELVTLSACETALGKYALGESFIGFPQAFLLSGARSVCVSLWKVDDTATSLLMTRFYQNILGQREGLKGPMPKAHALAESKAWLRHLSRADALKIAANAIDGVERGPRPKLPAAPSVPQGEGTDAEQRPFAHPYYWSAFVLIGDPN